MSKARQIYDETRKKDKTTMLFPEVELNQFGYRVLQGGRARDAIVIFQMNVDEYPGSANTYDSLSDAYLADGNNAEALRLAELAIAKLATDMQAPEEFKQQVRTSAERKIKQLKKGSGAKGLGAGARAATAIVGRYGANRAGLAAGSGTGLPSRLTW